MKAFNLVIMAALVAASIAAPFWFHRRAQADLASVENSERAQAAEISRLTAENARLAAPPAPALPEEQLKELLRLRNEVARLRPVVAETKQLRAAAASGQTFRTPAPTPSGPNYWPAGQLVYAGYATPESTLKTALWAMKNTDMNAMLACMSPEILAAMHNELQKDSSASAKAESQFKEMASSIMTGTAGFSLIDSSNAAPDLVTLRIAFEGQGVNQDYTLKKVGGDWKIAEASDPKLDEPSR